MFFAHRRLDRVERAIGIGKAFDRSHLTAIGLDGQHQAAPHGLAIDNHRAGAADAVFAAQMHAGIARVIAQEIAERFAGLDRGAFGSAIDRHFDAEGGLGLAHAAFLMLSASPRVRAKMRRPTVRRYSALAW